MAAQDSLFDEGFDSEQIDDESTKPKTRFRKRRPSPREPLLFDFAQTTGSLPEPCPQDEPKTKRRGVFGPFYFPILILPSRSTPAYRFNRCDLLKRKKMIILQRTSKTATPSFMNRDTRSVQGLHPLTLASELLMLLELSARR